MTDSQSLPIGQGPLFLDNNPDAAREAFAKKSKQLQPKVMSVADAVRTFVNDGDYLAAGGFGGDRIATALLHEIVRQNKQRLGVAGHTATHDFQILCAGNGTGRGQLFNRVDAAYIIGLEARGLSPHARRVVESGEVELCEWTNYTLALRFQAAAMGLPYLPARSMVGSDTFTQSAARTVVCPFTGTKLAAIPALWPDVAVIHVHEADRYGNCRIRGTSVSDYYLARAAKKLIISCERLIDEEEIRRDPTLTRIPYYCVDAVCEVRYGSYPANMPYEYFSDEDHLRQWLTVEKDPAGYQQFLNEYLFSPDDFNGYLDRCGGLPRLEELRRQELFPAN